jgi:hypothetical protein
MDIEGAELDVLSDCTDEELTKIKQITIEFHDFLYPEQRPVVIAVFERLRRLGFIPMRFSMDNSDALFLNSRANVSRFDVLYNSAVVKYYRGIGRIVRKRFAR